VEERWRRNSEQWTTAGPYGCRRAAFLTLPNALPVLSCVLRLFGRSFGRAHPTKCGDAYSFQTLNLKRFRVERTGERSCGVAGANARIQRRPPHPIAVDGREYRTPASGVTNSGLSRGRFAHPFAPFCVKHIARVNTGVIVMDDRSIRWLHDPRTIPPESPAFLPDEHTLHSKLAPQGRFPTLPTEAPSPTTRVTRQGTAAPHGWGLVFDGGLLPWVLWVVSAAAFLALLLTVPGAP